MTTDDIAPDDTATARVPRPRGDAYEPGTATLMDEPVGDGGSQLYRNGLALAASAGLSAVLGAGYWVVAAREASRVTVGQATALVSALAALALLGQLNIGVALSTFLPRAGWHRVRMVMGSTAVVIGTSVVLGGAFAVAAPRVDAKSFSVLASWQAEVAFALSVAVWSVFQLQDSVLIGMRRSMIVPVKNLIYTVAKFAMLVALAGSSAWLIFGAWVIPAAAGVVPVAILLVRRVLPSTDQPAADTSPATFRRFLKGETTAMIFDQLGVTFLPVLVVGLLGPFDGGAFGISWMIVQSLDILTISLGSSLIVEGAQPGADVDTMHHALRRRVLILLVGAVVLAEIVAPLVMRVFGPSYEASGTPVFRLLLLGSLARAVTVLAICAARARRRIGWIVRVHLALAVLVPGLAVLLGTTMGLTGIGLAWVASQTIVAGYVLATDRPRTSQKSEAVPSGVS